jgi:thiamine-monophosphate kinase
LKNEFDIIEGYFNHQFKDSELKGQLHSEPSDIIKGIGDDCAILKPKVGKLLVLSTDTLISGVHFPHQTNAKDIASKALAVNLSDLAAMGAKPAWFTLALTLPEDFTNSWLKDFSQQLFFIANTYAIILVGGDTIRGQNLSITIQVHGYVEQQAMLRSNAKVDDVILVSGELGGAALGLKIALEDQSIDLSKISAEDKKQALDLLNTPQPEINKGLLIAKYSRCAIDISDGMLADLGHILEQSQCAAIIDIDAIPIAKCLHSIDKDKSLIMALSGGDDYKLCITLSQQSWIKLQQDMDGEYNTGFYPIGKIIAGQGISFTNSSLANIELENISTGYNHFT